jgi:ribosome modulation factor
MKPTQNSPARFLLFGLPPSGESGGALFERVAHDTFAAASRTMNKQLATAFRKGYLAAETGSARLDGCPYRDKRSSLGRITFSRAFRNAWLAGYDRCQEDQLSGDMEGWHDGRID